MDAHSAHAVAHSRGAIEMLRPSNNIPLVFFDYFFVIVTFGFGTGLIFGLFYAFVGLWAGSVTTAVIALVSYPIFSMLFHAFAAMLTFHIYRWVANNRTGISEDEETQ